MECPVQCGCNAHAAPGSKTELEQIEVLKKHIARIQKNENLPVVLVLKELSLRQKEYLIREKIPYQGHQDSLYEKDG